MFKKLVFATVLLSLAVIAPQTKAVTYDEIKAYQLGLQTLHEDGPIGAAIPVVVSLFESSLQSKITASDSSMTLVSGVDRNGTSLSGYMCFTIDEGTASVEFVCGTASGTAVSTLTRGLDPLTGTSSVTALKKPHVRGASVKITNFPQDAILSRILNGNETLPNVISYDPSVASSTIALGLQNVASVAYVNSVGVSGAPNASTAAKGIAQAATAAQLAGSTAAGSTGALLFGPSSLYASSSSATTLVPVTNTNGKLSQGFLDLTASSTWTFSGPLTSNATTTILATTTKPVILDGVGYVFPNTQGAATTTLINNGSGILSWGTPGICKTGTISKNSADASTTQTIAHGLGVVPKWTEIELYSPYSSGIVAFAKASYNGTTQASVSNYTSNGTPATVDNSFTLNTSAFTGQTQAGTITFDATNISIAWVKTNSPTGTYTGIWKACSY